ncbi:hypothetical protein C8F04DRAFT_1365286 [Mycena alexandri]|uniref:DUF6534 domain-containing protein n=1 Tax=Mycena alexandri TaxID=1745969 RepID=A0AAD6SP19_9AGAR|nr:hypothetical protein C8F04DRAFT_1365286 [Mycena alexandri]
MDWALFAILTVQLCIYQPSSQPSDPRTSHLDLYYQAFPNDRVFTKSLVYTVYCISLIQVIIVTIDAFNTFGYGFGDPSALTHTKFAWLSGSKIVPSILVFAALGICVAGIIGGVTLRKYTALKLDLAKVGVHVPTGLAATTVLFLVGAASIDITIAGCMTYYLIKTDTGFRQTHALVTKLIRLSIETGVFTGLLAVLILALFFGIPGKGYYAVPGYVISTVYANTMFAVLNSRFHILNGRAQVVSITREEFSDGSNPPIELKKINGSAIAV